MHEQAARPVAVRSGVRAWRRYDAIRTGEAAEVLVLSKSRAFESFKVCLSVPEHVHSHHEILSIVLQTLLIDYLTSCHDTSHLWER